MRTALFSLCFSSLLLVVTSKQGGIRSSSSSSPLVLSFDDESETVVDEFGNEVFASDQEEGRMLAPTCHKAERMKYNIGCSFGGPQSQSVTNWLDGTKGRLKHDYCMKQGLARIFKAKGILTNDVKVLRYNDCKNRDFSQGKLCSYMICASMDRIEGNVEDFFRRRRRLSSTGDAEVKDDQEKVVSDEVGKCVRQEYNKDRGTTYGKDDLVAVCHGALNIQATKKFAAEDATM